MPNDEAFHNHPLFSVGLQRYAMQKIVNSPWIRERAAIAHKEGDPDWMMIDRHHFLFAFKENYVECVAKSCTSLGTFPSLENAVAHSNSVLLAI